MVKEGVDFKNQVGWIAKKAMQDAGVGLISTPFSLVVNYFFDPRREGDVTNYEKALIDGMKGIVFKDDRLLGRNKDPEFLDQGILFEAVFRKFFDKSNPRIEVMIVFYT
jgi:Holliday junction resolvase RusA-like endonuclease